METFDPRLTILPAPQLRLWAEMDATPDYFTLFGGTALALRFGHRVSVDFDFFTNQSFDPDQLARDVPYLRGAERLQVAPNTLTCRIDRDGPILVSFFGGLGLGQVAPGERVRGTSLYVASVLDLAGTKVAVIQKRAEMKDYLDIDALLQHGVELSMMLAAGGVIYGPAFNSLIAIKALSYFDDVPMVPSDVRQRLLTAVAGVDPLGIPAMKAFAQRSEKNEHTP